jgi:hypothetical protein
MIDEAVKASERALEIANIRYREGYADFQRVLDAQRTTFAQSERQLDVQANHIAAFIGLYKGLGGGWTETPFEQLIPEDVRKTMQDRTDWGDFLTTPVSETEDSGVSAQEGSQDE